MARSAATIFSLFIFIFLSLFPSSFAEIKTSTISSDSRPTILFDTFGFSPLGSVNITVSSASFSPSPLSSAPSDPSLVGFFLVTYDNITKAIIDGEMRQPMKNPNPNPSPRLTICDLTSPFVHVFFTFKDLTFGSYNNSFPVAVADEYYLYFVNASPKSLVSMNVRTEIFNARADGSRDYLSVGQSPVPSLYFVLFLAYFVFFVISICILFKNRLSTHRIHYLMAGLLLSKALNLMFAAEDLHYIQSTGTPHGWDVPFYLFQLLQGVLLFTVIVLIGAGWPFLKPFIQEEDKIMLMIVILLQVIANIASIMIGRTGTSSPNWNFWSLVFFLVDFMSCIAVIVPTIWSLKTLGETLKTDGKAGRNLAKVMVFRNLCVVVSGYLLFTRILIYLLKVTIVYKYRWACVVAEEVASLAFYVVMFYMLRSVVERKEHFMLNEEEEVAELAVFGEEEFEL